MRINQALLGVSRLFLDTAPVVYFVEENPYFLPLVSPIFTQIENGFLIGVASPVTLAECLVMPYRMSDLIIQQKFIDLLNNTENIEFFGSDRLGKKPVSYGQNITFNYPMLCKLPRRSRLIVRHF